MRLHRHRSICGRRGGGGGLLMVLGGVGGDEFAICHACHMPTYCTRGWLMVFRSSIYCLVLSSQDKQKHSRRIYVKQTLAALARSAHVCASGPARRSNVVALKVHTSARTKKNMKNTLNLGYKRCFYNSNRGVCRTYRSFVELSEPVVENLQ